LWNGRCDQTTIRRARESEGKIDKAKGAAHNVAGDVKDAVRKAGE
jgi:uncharacterized protein YjbJ (UPF0337 family)